jgi:hypothetical protein
MNRPIGNQQGMRLGISSLELTLKDMKESFTYKMDLVADQLKKEAAEAIDKAISKESFDRALEREADLIVKKKMRELLDEYQLPQGTKDKLYSVINQKIEIMLSPGFRKAEDTQHE